MHSILTWLEFQCKNDFEQGKNKYFFLTQICHDEDIVNFLKEYQLHLYLKGFLHLRAQRTDKFYKKNDLFSIKCHKVGKCLPNHYHI